MTQSNGDYEHVFDVTLSVNIRVRSTNRPRRTVTKKEIAEHVLAIFKDWTEEDVLDHMEGRIDYIESQVVKVGSDYSWYFSDDEDPDQR